MIQNLKNMIKLVYFNQLNPKQVDTKHFKKYRPKHLTKSKCIQQCSDNNIKQLCQLIKSQQKCQNWLILLQNYKQNYIIKQQLYNAILQGTITIHNLFLMLIQCKILTNDIWIPIQKLCKLKNDKDNQLCCLIHYTVTNLGNNKYKNIHNPIIWSNKKAQLQLGKYFQQVYNNNNVQLQLNLQDKIIILPMLIVLNYKNSYVLWNKLNWLYNFPYTVIMHLRNNMNRLLQQRISTTLTMSMGMGIGGVGMGGGGLDYFTSKMCIKSIQLLEVQGFISIKNLFSFAYQLYNISMILQLLANYKQGYDLYSNKTNANVNVNTNTNNTNTNNSNSNNNTNSNTNINSSSFRLQLVQFLVQLFDCMNLYEFQFDFTKNNKDIHHLKQIIVRNKLYMEELGDIRFNQQLQQIVIKYQQQNNNTQLQNKKHKHKHKQQQQQQQQQQQSVTKSIQNWLIQNFRLNNQQNIQNSSIITSLAKIIPRCSSYQWYQDIQHNNSLFTIKYQYQIGQNQQEYQQDSIIIPQKPQQIIAKFCNQRQQTILCHILCQLYHLKTDYLIILYSVLSDCYQRQQQPWSQISSSFYKLQLYLTKNYLLQFLVYNYNSIETKNSPLIMISYYKIIGLLMRGNPIIYAKMDKILLELDQQTNRDSNKFIQKKLSNYNYNNNNNKVGYKNEGKYLNTQNLLQYFASSFIENVALSKSTILMILSDQFQWKQNQAQAYPNATYDSFFVKKIIEKQQLFWMTRTIQSICYMKLTNIQQKNQNKQIKKQQILAKQYQRFQWVTLLLTLYYYFEETVQIANRNKRQAHNYNQKYGKTKDKQKIKAPNKAYLDKIMEKQKFMEKLYPKKIKVPFFSNQNDGQTNKQVIYWTQQRILNVLIQQLDKWQQFFDKNSKKPIIQYSLSYPMLKLFKKKLKNRIKGFIKTKEYEQNGQQFYFKYMKKKMEQVNY